jgi:hypothetical protein
VIPGPPPTTSKEQLAAEAVREAAELDATDFADLCIDTDKHNVVQVASQVRTRTGGWPRLPLWALLETVGSVGWTGGPPSRAGGTILRR